jgi:subtilisin family serine protease
MSLSGSSPNGTEKNGFQSLYEYGILSIAAASNEGTKAYAYPASYDSVISVGALDESMTWADFSNFNDQVELSAPGVGVLSTVPYIETNTVTVGSNIFSANHIEFSGRGTTTGVLVDGGLCGSVGSWGGKVVLCQRGTYSFYQKVINVQNGGGVAALVYNNVSGNFYGTLDPNSSTIIGLSLSMEDGQALIANMLGLSTIVVSTVTSPASGYEAWDGTSMATPHVSAVAALVWSCLPSTTNVTVRNTLTSTAMDLGAAGRDVYYG